MALRLASFKNTFEAVLILLRDNYPTLRAVPYWIGAVVVGGVAVGYTKIFEYVGALAVSQVTSHPLLWLGLSPLLMTLGMLLVHRFAPAAGGSGIPQVMAALEKGASIDERDLSRLLGFRVLLVKVLSSMLCLLGGGVIGREGPTIQIGASIFCSIHRRMGAWLLQSSPVPWIIAGSSAGLAAAFNTPLGGIVFAIEELASIHFSQFKIAVLSSVIIAGMMAQWLLGPYLYLGFFKVVAPASFTLGWVLGVAILSAIAGAYFGKLLSIGATWTRGLSLRTRIFLTVLCAVGVVALGIMTHTQSLKPGTGVIQDALTQASGTLTWQALIGRYASMLLSYLSGCAGGIFAPSLSMGAAIGASLARLFELPDVNLLTMTGMTAFLCAVTRSPFTAAVLVLEMTDRHRAVFPIMLASLAGYASAYLIDKKPFYRRQMRFYLKSPAPASTLAPFPAHD